MVVVSINNSDGSNFPLITLFSGCIKSTAFFMPETPLLFNPCIALAHLGFSGVGVSYDEICLL